MSLLLNEKGRLHTLVQVLKLWGHIIYSKVKIPDLKNKGSVSQFGCCDLMDCSTPGLPVHHQFMEFTQTHLHWVGDAIQPSHPLSSPFPPALNLSQHQDLFKCQFFAWGGQSIGVSSSTSVLPMNIQDWFPLGGTGLICLPSTSLQ